MKKPKICVAGSSNMDLVTSVDRMPFPGETIHGRAFHTFFGGKGANQAVMAAKLGGDVSLVAKIGEDSFGMDYMKNFLASGLNTTYVYSTRDVSTGIAAITVDDGGQNSIVVVGGANNAITIADIDNSAPAIREADIVVCQNEITFEATVRFLKIAKEYGVTVIFNPAPAQKLPDELYGLSDYFCPNETEAALMAGFTVDTIEDAEKAGRIFLSRGAKAVIITLGSRGSLFVSGEKAFHVPAEKVRAIDTTGAGDAFIGSMAFFLASGERIEDAMKKASHVAALSVQKSGAQTSYPTLEECGF
ncbi:MAG: ribokinase [Flexilinea sp.]